MALYNHNVLFHVITNKILKLIGIAVTHHAIDGIYSILVNFTCMLFLVQPDYDVEAEEIVPLTLSALEAGSSTRATLTVSESWLQHLEGCRRTSGTPEDPVCRILPIDCCTLPDDWDAHSKQSPATDKQTLKTREVTRQEYQRSRSALQANLVTWLQSLLLLLTYAFAVGLVSFCKKVSAKVQKQPLQYRAMCSQTASLPQIQI